MKKLLFFSLFPFLVMSQTQIGNDIDGQNAADCSGVSVSLCSDGNVLAIGSPCYKSNLVGFGSGQVRVFKNILGVWTQIGNDIDGKIPNYGLGVSVSLSSDGSIVAIQNYSTDNSSNIQIYENTSGIWSQIGDAIRGGVGFGTTEFLSLNGSCVALINFNSITNSSQVTVYKNISGVWTQIGNNIEVQNANTLSLSSDGTIIAIGIRYPSSIESGKSKVTVYENISGVWTQLGLDFNGESGNLSPELSLSLSSDGTILAIGDTAIRHDLGPVRVYKNISGVWTQVGESIKANEFDELGRFGFPVRLSADGSIIAIGARESDVNGNDSGQVRIYKNISQVWTQIGSDINGEAIRDVSGASISLTSDGSKLAIGAPANDGNGEGSGHVRVFDLSGILSSDSFVLANFSVYPNPASSMVTITLQKGLLLEKVNIYNTLGQLVKTEKKNSIAVNSLTKGSYFFEVVTNEGKAVKTIVIH